MIIVLKSLKLTFIVYYEIRIYILITVPDIFRSYDLSESEKGIILKLVH